jgi:hypothetical protein
MGENLVFVHEVLTAQLPTRQSAHTFTTFEENFNDS